MILARMIKVDEASLICDFAETYHIYDYRSLPVGLASTLAFGLGDDSRIKMKLSGQRAKTSVLLLASIADGIHLLLWSASKAGTPKPKLFTEILMHDESKETEGFETSEAFEKRLQELRG